MAQALVSKPVEPVYNVDALVPNVVVWTKYDGYSYASLQSPDGLWFTTQDPGRSGRQRIFPGTWEELLEVIGERNWSTISLLG